MTEEVMTRVRLKELERNVEEMQIKFAKKTYCFTRKILEHGDRINVCEIMTAVAVIMSSIALFLAIVY